MSLRLEVRPQARSDIEAAHAWYELQRPGLGDEFLAGVDDVIKAALLRPEAYVRVHGQMRRVLLERFPYGLYYLAKPDAVVVLACTHLRRHPHQWRSRWED